ncbi:MAG TPA: CAP domain-containing protein [Saprospiraceae bacterium]|nr:CAP domain-containing protein [Saprospiraceae bacterium]
MKLGTLGKISTLVIMLVVFPLIGGRIVNNSNSQLPTNEKTSSLTPQTQVEIRDQTTALVIETSVENIDAVPQSESEPVKVAQSEGPASQSPKAVQDLKPKPVTPTPELNLSQAAACYGTLSQEFICLLNEYRDSKGFGPVSSNNSLVQVAFSHSKWMNETGIFSHTGINGSRLSDRCAAAGIRCLAENLAHNILTAQQLLDSWKANPGHNKNLLGPYNTIGLGVFDKYVTLLMN